MTHDTQVSSILTSSYFIILCLCMYVGECGCKLAMCRDQKALGICLYLPPSTTVQYSRPAGRRASWILLSVRTVRLQMCHRVQLLHRLWGIRTQVLRLSKQGFYPASHLLGPYPLSILETDSLSSLG